MSCLGGLSAIQKKELDKMRVLSQEGKIVPYLEEMEQVYSCELW